MYVFKRIYINVLVQTINDSHMRYEVKHAILLARSKNDEKSNTFVYITFRALYTIRN
jgi:hypothetical protein